MSTKLRYSLVLVACFLALSITNLCGQAPQAGAVEQLADLLPTRSPLVSGVRPLVCGDADNNGGAHFEDGMYLHDYMYHGGPAPPVMEQGDADSLSGITNNDIGVMVNYIFNYGPPPYCPPYPDTILPVYDDTLKIMGLKVPPGQSSHRVLLWLTNVDTIWAFAFPFSYACSTSAILLDSISFRYSRIEDFDTLVRHAIVNTSQQKALIGVCQDVRALGGTRLMEGSGMLAQLHFTVNPSADTQYIQIDTTTFEPSHIVIFTTLRPPRTEGFLPTIVWSPEYICVDSDGDGFGDPGHPENMCLEDNCPSIYNPNQGDFDADGEGDSCDACTDGDGDGFGDPGFPVNTCALDNCPYIANPDQEDVDEDAVGDSCDNCLAIANPDQENADGDAQGDSCDTCTDTDGDGFGNPGYPLNTCPDDNCPSVSDPHQFDIDGDAVGDVCDNCMTVFNPDQADSNSDGIGDACDTIPMYEHNVEIHINFPRDTVFTGETTTLEFWIANDEQLIGMALPFEFSGYVGSIIWDTLYGSYPPVNEENNADSAFLLSTYYHGLDDLQLPDSLAFGGAYWPGVIDGLRPCPYMRLCYTAQFEIPWGEPVPAELCIDNIFMPPAAAWLFDTWSERVVPDYHGCVNSSENDPDCPAVCFPVVGDDVSIDFSASPRCGQVPLSVSFSDLTESSAEIISWLWDFGDGQTSQEQNPENEYDELGVYDVTLTVSDGTHYKHHTKEQFIIASSGTTLAEFQACPRTGSAHDYPSGQMTSLFEPLAPVPDAEYFWDFGNGQTSTDVNPVAYFSLGTYDVKLRATIDVAGCTLADSLTKEGFIVVNGIDARFEADSRAGIPGHSIQFYDESLSLPDPADEWYWDFGDGETSVDQDPSHQYLTQGVFDVFLRVSNGTHSDSVLRIGYVHIRDGWPDVTVNPNGYGEARPGFTGHVWAQWGNIGVLSAYECILKVLLPGTEVLDVLCKEYTGYYWPAEDCSYAHWYEGDTLFASLGSIQPRNDYNGYLDIIVQIDDTLGINDTLFWEMWISTTSWEAVEDNNYALMEVPVMSSWDPNDKLAHPGGRTDWYPIAPDQRLSYLIQFENKAEATAEAIYVRIIDTLDTDLDWGSLSFGGMSHEDDCIFQFDPYTGVITWVCDSIMLPPNVNPPEGEGFVSFMISPNSDLADGTEITNCAWIRFDYNPWLQAPEEGPLTRVITYPYVCGDADGNTIVEITDAVYLINFVFVPGSPAPDPYESGDVDCNGIVEISDAVYLINYVFVPGSPDPCDPDGDGEPDC